MDDFGNFFIISNATGKPIRAREREPRTVGDKLCIVGLGNSARFYGLNNSLNFLLISHMETPNVKVRGGDDE